MSEDDNSKHGIELKINGKTLDQTLGLKDEDGRNWIEQALNRKKDQRGSVNSKS